MKIISRKLRRNSLFAIGMLILMISVLIWSFDKTRQAHDNDLLADAILSSIFERAALRDRYLLHHEERAKNEWLSEVTATGLLLEKAAVRLDDHDFRVIVEQIRNYSDDTAGLFTSVVKNAETVKPAGSDIRADGELEKKLVSLILAKDSNLQAAARQLQRSAQHRLDEDYQRSIALACLFIALVVLFTVLAFRIVNSLLTNREQAEQKLKKEASLNKALLDTVRAVVLIQDKDDSIVYFNRFSEELSGYSSAEVLGKTAWDFLSPPEEMEPVRQAWNGLKTGKKLGYFENNWKTRNGELRCLAWTNTVIPDDAGEPEYIIAIAFDITGRKQAETEREQYFKFFNSSDDLMTIADPNGCFKKVNPACLKALGCSEEELLSKPFVDFVHPDDRQATLDEMVRQLQRGFSINFENRYMCKNGSFRWLSWHAIYVAAEGVTYATARDVTERNRITAELAAARKAAEAASRAKSSFLANMSHEIRTPMNGIMGMAELLGYTGLSDDQREYLDAIQTSADSLLSLINDVLDLSKIEAGKIELEQIEFSLRDSISDVVKTQISQVHAKELVIKTDITAGIPDCLAGDQLRLKQILINLVGNAVKFTEKGTINISVGMSGHGDNALFQFSVLDTGIGIEQESIERIFAPFSQADNSITRKYGGTGLGLSICTKLVERMSGRIWAESSVGNGSAFHVEIPFVVSDAAIKRHGNTRKAQPTQWEGAPLHILLVEDQEINQRFAMQILQRRGHLLDAAQNGREAIEKWEKGGLDIILMDVQMPVMDGIQATKVIREREVATGNSIPIIALTAHALREDREQFLKLGFDGYVSKPLEIDALTREMKRCMAESEKPVSAAAMEEPAVQKYMAHKQAVGEQFDADGLHKAAGN